MHESDCMLAHALSQKSVAHIDVNCYRPADFSL